MGPYRWPKTTNYQEVLGGFVVDHGPDNSALYQKVHALPASFDIAVRYTGPVTLPEEFINVREWMGLGWAPLVFEEDEPEVRTAAVTSNRKWWQFWR